MLVTNNIAVKFHSIVLTCSIVLYSVTKLLLDAQIHDGPEVLNQYM